MATIKCRCNDSIEIDSGNNRVYLTPTYSSGVGEVIICGEEQAQQLYSAIGKMIAELWPEKEPEGTGIYGPFLHLTDRDGDKLGLNLHLSGGSAYLTTGRNGVYLSSDHTQQLYDALGRKLKANAVPAEVVKPTFLSIEDAKYAAQENAKPKPVSSTIFDFPMPSGYGVIDWSVSPIGYGVVSRGTIEIPSPDEAPKPKPKPKTYTITINLKE